MKLFAPVNKLPTSRCPVCRYEMEAATHIGPEYAEPSAGDVSICLNCGELLQFNDILVMKSMPTDIFDGLDETTKGTLAEAKRIILKRGHIR